MSLHLTGFPTAQQVDLSMTIGGTTDSIDVTEFRKPAAISGFPRIDAMMGQQFTTSAMPLALTETGLTGITSRQWRIKGGANLGTAATQSLAAVAVDSEVECEIVCDQGTFVTPSVRVYAPISDSKDHHDMMLLMLLSHCCTTHIAVATGDWSDTGTWLGGIVPGHGARVLIQHGVTVTYDQNARRDLRLDLLRVDGELKWRQTGNTYMLVETIIVTRGGLLEIGTASNRISSGTTHEILFSDRDYRTAGHIPTDISLARDGELLGRGLISQGESRVWAASKTNWLRTAAGNPPMAEDTTITLAAEPTGWNVGDDIVIGGTEWTPVVNESQSEVRRITAISGANVTFVSPLEYDHSHQNDNLPAATADDADLQPGVGNLRRNVRFLGENPNSPFWRRGHIMVMHEYSETDWWGAELGRLGRTLKTATSLAGTIRNGNEFWIVTRDRPAPGEPVGGVINAGPVTARSNLQGRYSFHFHFVGFNKAFRDVINDAAVYDVPGWGLVHHGSKPS